MKEVNSKDSSIFTELEFQTILDSINDPVFIDDKKGYALWCNKAWERVYEVPFEEVKGKHVKDLERDGIFSPSVTSIVLEEKREATIIHENKRGIKLLSTGTPIWDEEGNISKIITTSRDITELTLMQNRLISDSLVHVGNKDNESAHPIAAISQQMKNVLQIASRLASVDSTVLLTGESGVGKSMIAKFLYENGKRREGPFISVNCGAIPENLIESELFGYEKGAFTGARSEGKKGFFESAQNGTIFLDEIGDLPLSLQVRLLHVIQEREIQRVGGTKMIPINVRIISATNRNLRTEVNEGRFREDLYYRLNVVPIKIPPLRERPEDIPALTELFLKKYNERHLQNKTITADALNILTGFQWYGNIRELENIIERLIITTSCDEIDVENLPEYILEASSTADAISHGGSLSDQLARAEKRILEKSAEKHHSTREIAKDLQTSQPTIVRKLNKYQIQLTE